MKNEVKLNVINGRNVYSIDVGDMKPDEAQKYLDDIYDEKHGIEIGTSFKAHKTQNLHFNISIGFFAISYLALVFTKYYYGVL